MSVNFTGIKNIGAINMLVPTTGQQVNIMSFQAVNDEDGNDFDRFCKEVGKTDNPDLILSRAGNGFVSLEVIKSPKEEDYESDNYDYYVNGKKLEVKDSNLGLFSYFAKLTTCISKGKPEDFGFENEYVSNPAFVRRTAIGNIIKNMFLSDPQMNLAGVVTLLHSEQNVKFNAQIVNHAINSTIIDYMG